MSIDEWVGGHWDDLSLKITPNPCWFTILRQFQLFYIKIIWRVPWCTPILVSESVVPVFWQLRYLVAYPSFLWLHSWWKTINLQSRILEAGQKLCFVRHHHAKICSMQVNKHVFKSAFAWKLCLYCNVGFT